MARALEFSPQGGENSGGPKPTEPTNKSGTLADAALVGGMYNTRNEMLVVVALSRIIKSLTDLY